jgi:hypothetical protein
LRDLRVVGRVWRFLVFMVSSVEYAWRQVVRTHVFASWMLCSNRGRTVSMILPTVKVAYIC